MALVGLAILCCTSACSERPVEEPPSRFTQDGLDAIAQACGAPARSLILDGANSVHFSAAVIRDYSKLNCVQTKIRETYYLGAADPQEGKHAQAH